MRKLFKAFPFFQLFFVISLSAQKAGSDVPRLVVGIVVDQMRNEFIYRYWDRFGNDGFKRLVNEGFYFRNANFNYMPTYTGPGHCSIYTGTTPRRHGIIANNWYVKGDGTETYCVYDHTIDPVGTDGSKGKMSPARQLCPTIGDELKMSSNQRSKVFAVALKDRGAVLPAGHAANAAFWFEAESGNFVSSAWYLDKLPEWLNDFNKKGMAREYLRMDWNLMYPAATYTNSIADDNRYEEKIMGKDRAVFPYSFKNARESGDYSVIPLTPYGNSLVKDVALACLKEENLGQGPVPDLLCISFSGPDYAGHAFGPRSVEVEDIYLRLDKDIADILKSLDELVGKNRYSVFLTADHGGAEVPNHLLDHKIPAGYVYEKAIGAQLKGFLQSAFGDSLLLANVSNEQVFLNMKRMADANLDADLVEQRICEYLISVAAVSEAYPSAVLRNSSFAENDLRTLLQNGYNHQMSGNVAFVYRPNYMDHGQKGTSHGSGYAYDTHVPLIFFGQGIKKGQDYSYIPITRIAPTVAELLKISKPAACQDAPLNGFFR